MKLYKQMLLFTLLLILTQVSCTRQNTKAADAGKSQQADAPAKMVEMKTVTDHAGNKVEIPASPKRIGSLHTLTTSVMLFDLEADLIGVSTRLKKDENNRPYIRGVEELYGVKFEDTQLFNYGDFGEDIEQIKLSKPDLIVGRLNDLKKYKQLSGIAPTVLIDGARPNMYGVFKDLASWVGKEYEFNKKEKLYKNRLQSVKAKFSKNPKEQTVAYMHPYKGKANYLTCSGYSSFTIVAHDLGFENIPYIKQQLPDPKDKCTTLSSETFAQFNPDWMLSTYRHQFGETVEDVYAALDDIAPGWKNYNSAYKNNQIIIMNRAKAMTSFKALNEVLDVFEKAAK